MGQKKELVGYIIDVGNDRQYKATISRNGYEQDIWVNLYEYVGYRVKMIQKLKKISNKELTKKVGFSNQTVVSRIKTGKHALRLDTIYRLCIGLGCKSSDLLPF